MDGWGLGKNPAVDAIAHSRTPFVSSLYGLYPHSELITCGEAVGLPEGQMGNSEVGHLNMGAGRIVYQELQRIQVAIRSGELARNPRLLRLLKEARTKSGRFHLMGLLSDGGVHSHISHLQALLDIAHDQGIPRIFLHAFTDGRDTDPHSGLGFLEQILPDLPRCGAELATITGRYYAMDRDKRWERVALAYQALVQGSGKRTRDPLQSVRDSYTVGVTDEFIRPIIHTDEAGDPLGEIRDGDTVLCFNFRTDRCREITLVLTQEAVPGTSMKPLSLHYGTMTQYDQAFRGVQVLFENKNLEMTLGETLSGQGKSQIRIAETEKYPHVTFFFSGGREQEFPCERRILIPSPKVATYDLQPEMSAPEVTDAVVGSLERDEADFICLNFANADMVGHTGVWQAVIRAVETVDRCVGRVVEAALKQDYIVLLTADHGNADFMVNADASPNTAHSLNPVPCFLIGKGMSGTLKDGKLADLAPTLLSLMGLSIPAEMTGEVLYTPA